jgi:hypothetical protein
MLNKGMRRAERRWRSHCVWMRRLRHDWATHGWNWNYLWIRPGRYSSEKASCSIWAETTLCECFYDPSFKGMGRFKDTPSMGHRQRSCNGKDGDRINEYKAEQQLEVEKELHGTSQRLRKRLHRQEPRRMKVTCLCGYVVGHVMVKYGESKYTAISRKYGDRHPKCPNCDERMKKRLAG